jgi:hypothetical protein
MLLAVRFGDNFHLSPVHKVQCDGWYNGQRQFPKSAREGFSMNGILAQADPMLT